MSYNNQTDIESRIAQLDERLRVARAENSTLRDRLSPSPAHHRNPNSNIGGGVSSTPVSSAYHNTTGGGYTATAPQVSNSAAGLASTPAASAAASRGAVASPRLVMGEPTVNITNTSSSSYSASRTSPARGGQEVMTGQIRELQQRLSNTNRSILDREKEIAEQQRRKTIVAAESAKAVDDADLRIRDAQERAARNQHLLSDLQSKRSALGRQLEEVQQTTQRTEQRLQELERTKTTLDAKIGEANVALREREQAVNEETDSFRAVRQRLERRYADLEEENHAASERLRRIESQFQTQQQQWREEEDTLQRECDEAASLLDEMTSRLQSLKSELVERQRESEEQKQVRERRAEELHRSHEEERRKDAEYHKQTLDQREQALLREREEVLSGLRQQIELLNRQLDRKKQNRDIQDATNSELERALHDVNGKLEQKATLAENVRGAEDRLRQATEERDHRKTDLQQLRDNIMQREQQIANLDKVAQRLAHQLEEEKRLKGLVADLARQINDLALTQDVEKAGAERNLKQLQEDKSRADEQVASVAGEIERTRSAGNADIDLLRRKCESTKREINDKEAQLRKALQENAAKQSQLSQYDDERRRMEREQLMRRSAAHNAAKAAMTELQ